MKQLYYTLMTLLRGKGSNIIKVISLTLGLFIGIILFARVAFELSFNSGYQDADKLAVIQARYYVSGLPNSPFKVVMGPVPAAIAEAFPNEVESATVTRFPSNWIFKLGEDEHSMETWMADSLFFQTMGIRLTSGIATELAMPNAVFICDEMARRVFGTTDVIGRTLMLNGTQEVPVRGTFERPAENNDDRPEAVFSITTYMSSRESNFGWGGGDSYYGYVRLKNASDLEKVNAGIDAVIEQHMPFDLEANGWGVKYSLESFKKAHTNDPNVRMIVLILTLLAVSILLIAAMNYVLIAISGLARRAKAVGVHKVNGASNGKVFGMFLLETGILIAVSLLLVLVLTLNFRGLIEDLIEVKLSALFTLQTLWVPISVILIVFLVAGVIPGRMFVRIPVTQVFRRYTERNSSWKRVLLFVQFAGVSFVFGVLVVVFLQYKQAMNYDLGYNTDGIVEGFVRNANRDIFKTTVRNLPMVEGVSFSAQTVGVGYSGEMVEGDGQHESFSSRINSIDENFIPLYEMKIIEGRNLQAPGEMVVNKAFVEAMRWTDSAIGKSPFSASKSFGSIVGVIDDIVDNSLFMPKNPVAFLNIPSWSGMASIKLKEPYTESLDKLNIAVKEAFPAANIEFRFVGKRLESAYSSIRRFRDSAGVAFAAILLITLMGLVGYINDEIQRRSKEIAIRKVNGAEAWSILGLLGREVAFVAIPSIAAGIILSYFVGKEGLDFMVLARVEQSFSMYLLLSLCMLMVIIVCVVLKSWSIANENPVISIKSE